MSREVSSATGKAYGVKRVCATLKIPRSTVYARQQAASLPQRVCAILVRRAALEGGVFFVVLLVVVFLDDFVGIVSWRRALF